MAAGPKAIKSSRETVCVGDVATWFATDGSVCAIGTTLATVAWVAMLGTDAAVAVVAMVATVATVATVGALTVVGVAPTTGTGVDNGRPFTRIEPDVMLM